MLASVSSNVVPLSAGLGCPDTSAEASSSMLPPKTLFRNSPGLPAVFTASVMRSRVSETMSLALPATSFVLAPAAAMSSPKRSFTAWPRPAALSSIVSAGPAAPPPPPPSSGRSTTSAAPVPSPRWNGFLISGMAGIAPLPRSSRASAAWAGPRVAPDMAPPVSAPAATASATSQGSSSLFGSMYFWAP